MSDNQFDLIIVGAGAGGYVAAFRAVQSGLKVALIEKEKVGGICLNWGCVPSKSLQASAELLERLKKAEDFGLSGVDFDKVKPDWETMLKRAQTLAGQFASRTELKLTKSGVKLIKGEAKVLTPEKVLVDGIEYFTKDLVLATGSNYTFPEFLNKVNERFYTPKSIYNLKELPKTMTIIGGGVIGIEFASLFSSLGVKVNLVDHHFPLMPYMDHDLTEYLLEILRRKQIKLYCGFTATAFEDNKLKLEKVGNKTEVLSLDSEVYLSAIARQGNVAGLEPLINKGLEVHRGHVKTDLRCRTSLPHVYAVGDLNGRFMTAHVAAKEGLTAVETILGNGEDIIYDFMPYNMYSNPEFASVGLTEKEALHKGFLVSTGKFSLSHNAKAQADGDGEGFIKIVFDKKTEEILGVHIATKNATDLIGEAIVAMSSGMTLKQFASLTHPHPTLAEALVDASFKGMGY